MKLINWNKKLILPVLIISLLVALLGTVTACADMGFPSSTPTTPQEQPAPEKTPTIFIGTKDTALLAVYQRLLGQAESYEAKIYLADFYAICDNWSAESEFFKDGSGTWHVQVDMTSNMTLEIKPHWQQASWFVFKGGKVIPSNRFQANALRIEAELLELSPKPEIEPSQAAEDKT